MSQPPPFEITLDQESANDVISSFEDHFEVLQLSLNKLMHHTEDLELLNTAFRSMHTIKGNAAMVQLEPIVTYTHAMEETMGSIRAGYFKLNQTLCELLLTAIDRLRELHNKYIFKKDASVDEQGVTDAFFLMAKSRTEEEVMSHCEKLIALFNPQTSDSHISSAPPSSPLLTLEKMGQHEQYLTLTETQADDLVFFRLLSLQVDEQNNFWVKRTDILLYLALKTALLSDKEMDLVQLSAAIYMHDAGMAFVPDSIVNKNTRLNTLEAKKLQQHPIWSYNLLKRIPGWEPASEMVLAHHERIDGEGYPYQKKGDETHEGAKLLAIVDAYYAMTHLRADRIHRRSILRALSEINACIDTQFCGYWVNLFNQVIRLEVKNGSLI